jgi:hypothetical protein
VVVLLQAALMEIQPFIYDYLVKLRKLKVYLQFFQEFFQLYILKNFSTLKIAFKALEKAQYI